MRQILVDFGRERGCQKRGGVARKVSLDEAHVIGQGRDEALEAVDDALSGLTGIGARKSAVVVRRVERRRDSRSAQSFSRGGPTRSAAGQILAAAHAERGKE